MPPWRKYNVIFMMTISALLDQGQKVLSDTESPLIDSQVLLCHVLDVDRSYLYKAPEELVSEKKQKNYTVQIKKRQQGTPVSHLTGHREFWSLDLKVTMNTLIPRPETEHLVEAALAIINLGSIKHIADLGTGTGAIALSLASEIANVFPDCQIVATDISPQALAIARENLEKYQLKNIELRLGNWCEALGDSMFDLIVSNPPYITRDHPCLNQGDVQHEPMLALKSGTDGLNAIRQIIDSVPDSMNTNAWLILEHGYDQKKAVQKLLQNRGFQKIETLKDYANLDRITLGQWLGDCPRIESLLLDDHA